ncbi:MAG: tRNA (adenosine(37)-N6)-threonylcarbamoyltransferase complex dimerization subunit type 1 TsaB [Ruminococcaceae bacterium]|nr:tRNA (adenosine(37)-N6)-threonylcarbamoyltransferase complex dimerization subunit type 1 TsaB [Oscillospiraceae bacterium]
MRILAVDTSAPTATAAIMTDGRLTGLYSLQTNTHSTTLLPMIESMLEKLQMTVEDMDLLTATVGPGSFTGIRIGVSTVKGLAFTHNIPCIGVSSLEAMAWNLSGFQGILCPALNARRNHVYTAFFSCDGINPPERLTEDDVLPVEEVCEKLKQYGKPVYVTGDGYTMLHKPATDGLFMPTPEMLRYPNAFGAAQAAQKHYTEAEDKTVFTEGRLQPVYLRKSQAEREREERLAAENAK